MIKKLLFGVIALLAAYYLGNCCSKNETEIPRMPEPNWGPVDGTKDSSVRPFKISVPKDVINDLKERLSRTREPVPPLENVGWTYGLSSKYFQKIIDYWINKYDWYKRQDLLNKYPQFITNIQGLDIHFYHVKPSKSLSTDGKPLKVLPLLLVHGWPGSVVEFQKIIPMLTTPRPGKDFVFEVIAPSLPGYGFSQGAVRPHMGHAQMAVVMKNLMTRLGFDKFYTQGGDWGSAITTDISTLFPERVTGAHLNMCGVRNSKSFFWLLVGSYFPSLVVESEHYSKVYPLTEKWSRLLEESGYFHLQATKPDTIGTALMQAPASLATYILEKFSTWTNPEYRFRDDGGLLEKFSMDELLDNVMVYWITDSITTSVRLYAESFSSENNNKYDSLTTNVPVACANFPHELTYTPKSLIEMRFKNLIQFNHLPRGGHFAAFEEPKLLADDFWTFVEKVEQKFTK